VLPYFYYHTGNSREKMSKFYLTAQLAFKAPSSGNIQQVLNQVNQRFKNGVNVQVNVQVPKNVNTQLNHLSQSINRVSKSSQQASSSIEEFGKQAAQSIRHFGAFTIATTAFINLIGAIRKGIGDAIEFDHQIVRISQVTGTLVKDLGGLKAEITRVATAYGVSANKLAEVAVTLSQAGIAAKDVTKALDTLAKTELAATFGDIKDTTEASIAIMRQFNLTTGDLEAALGAVNRVSADFAVEAEDITAAVTRAGGAFNAAGGKFNEFIALLTSVRQTTRASAESISTGFNTIFARIQRNNTQESLKNLGINLRYTREEAERLGDVGLTNQFVGAFEAVKRLNEGLKDLRGTDPRFAAIVEELGGFRQIRNVIPLIQQVGVAQRAYNVAQAAGKSLDKDRDVAMQALAKQLGKVREEFSALIREIADNRAFRATIHLMLNLASAAIKVVDAIQPILPLLAALGAIRAGQAFRSFAGGFKENIFNFNRFNSGGLVPGRGPNKDTVPAALTKGEYVLRRDAVDKIGVGTLNSWNSGKGFNKGGYVGGGRAQDDDESIVLGALNQAKLEKGSDARNKAAVALLSKAGFGVTPGMIGKYFNRSESPVELKNIIGTKGKPSAADAVRQSSSPGIFKNPLTIGTDEGPLFGGYFLQPGDGGGGVEFSRANDPTDFDLIINRLSAINKKADLSAITKIRIPLDAAVLEDDKKKIIRKSVVNNFLKGIHEAASAFGKPALKPTEENYKRLALDSVAGVGFEGVLASYQPHPFDGDEPNQTFDFPSGQIIPQLFPNAREGVIRDAKLTFNKGSVSKDEGSIKNKIRAVLTGSSSQIPLSRVAQAIVGFNSGGINPKDNIPAMLTKGEYVLNPDTVRQIGVNNLDKLNNLRGYNQGGYVGLNKGGDPRKKVHNAATIIQDRGTATRAELSSLALAHKAAGGKGFTPDELAERLGITIEEAAKDATKSAKPMVAKNISKLLTESIEDSQLDMDIYGARTAKIDRAAEHFDITPQSQNSAFDGNSAKAFASFFSDMAEQKDAVRSTAETTKTSLMSGEKAQFDFGLSGPPTVETLDSAEAVEQAFDKLLNSLDEKVKPPADGGGNPPGSLSNNDVAPTSGKNPYRDAQKSLDGFNQKLLLVTGGLAGLSFMFADSESKFGSTLQSVSTLGLQLSSIISVTEGLKGALSQGLAGGDENGLTGLAGFGSSLGDKLKSGGSKLAGNKGGVRGKLGGLVGGAGALLGAGANKLAMGADGLASKLGAAAAAVGVFTTIINAFKGKHEDDAKAKLEKGDVAGATASIQKSESLSLAGGLEFIPAAIDAAFNTQLTERFMNAVGVDSSLKKADRRTDIAFAETGANTLSKRLDAFNTGKSTNLQLNDANATSLFNAANSSDEQTRTAGEQALKQVAPAVLDSIRKQVDSGKVNNLGDAEKIVGGADRLKKFVEAAGITMKDFEGELKKSAHATQIYSSEQLAAYRNLQTISALNKTLGETQLAFDDVNSSITAFDTGEVSIPDFGKIFEDAASGQLGAQGNSTLSNLLGRVGAQSPEGAGVAEGARLETAVMANLDGIFKQIQGRKFGAKGPDGEPISSQEAFLQVFKDTFKGQFSDDALKSYLGGVGSVLESARRTENQESNQVEFGIDRKAIFDAFDGQNVNLETAKNAAAQIAGQERVLQERIKRRLEIEQQYIDTIASVIDMRASAEAEMAKILGDGVDKRSLAQQNRFTDQKLNSILGGSGLTSRSNPQAIAGANLAAREELSKIQGEARAGGPVNLERQEELTRIINDTGKALEFLSTNTEKAANIREKLNQLEQQRQERKGFASDFLFSSNEGRVGMAKNVLATQQAAQSGSVENLTTEQRSGVKSIIDAFRNTQNKAFGRDEKTGQLRTGAEFEKFLLEKAGFKEGVTQMTEFEKQNVKLLQDQLNAQQAAAEALMTIQKAQMSANAVSNFQPAVPVAAGPIGGGIDFNAPVNGDRMLSGLRRFQNEYGGGQQQRPTASINTGNLDSSVANFTGGATQLSSSLDNFPREILGNFTVKHEHIFNGLEVFKQMEPAFAQLANTIIEDRLNKFVGEKLPDLGQA
jgi:TP901 family phage tail tape measure protein